MRKLICAIMLLLAWSVDEVHSQTFGDGIHLEASAGTGIKDEGVTPVDFSFKLNVDFVSIFYLFIAAEDNISLYKRGGIKDHSKGVSGGGGVGVRLFNSVKSNHAFDFRVKSLASFGNPDWKRTTYDAALAWYLKSEKFSPVVELGYRFIDSRTKGFDNYGNAYLSIGLRY